MNSPFILLDYLKKNIKPTANIIIDTRKLYEGDIFFVYSMGFDESKNNNSKYINLAIQKKAGIIVYDSKDINIEFKNILKNYNSLEYNNLAIDAGFICSEWYSNSYNKCNIIGVTGTNGKTSITQWLSQILDTKDNIATIGTLGIGKPDELIESGYTTPDAVTIQYEINKLFKKNINYLIIEVSSHSLDQGRVNSINFKTAIFTNLTQDHLDYHITMENYGKAKEQLFNFNSLENAIINIDNDFGQNIVHNLISNKKNINIWVYSIDKDICYNFISEFKYNINFICLLDYKIIKNGYVSSIKINDFIINDIFLPLYGEFNISNCLAIISVLLLENINIEDITSRISKLKPVTGRMDMIYFKNLPYIIIDFAHTPDALQNIITSLTSLKKLLNGNIWTIFGCGGNRDTKKRPIMGKIAEENSDYIILTNDNPRFENPAEIINMILLGMNKKNKNIFVIQNRELAIKYAYKYSKSNDIILIAGKGHETTQEIDGVKYYFSDKEVINKIINKNI